MIKQTNLFKTNILYISMPSKKKNIDKDLNLAKKDMDKTIKILEQTGKVKSIVRDRGRDAKLPGKRISKNGNTYYERRKNRSDAPLKKT